MSCYKPLLQVELIWKGKRKGLCECRMKFMGVSCSLMSSVVVYLFLFVCCVVLSRAWPRVEWVVPQNRYFTPLGFIINLFGVSVPIHCG